MLRRAAAAALLQALLAASLKEPDLGQALAAHCGQQGCPPRQPGLSRAELRTRLIGKGMHREMEYEAVIHCDSGTAQAGAAACEVAVLQPLPAVVYANIYELENAAQLGQGPSVQLFGPVDVESIERDSQPTVLVAYAQRTEPPQRVGALTLGSAHDIVGTAQIARYTRPAV